MARLLAWLALAAYVTATNHGEGSGEGGNGLPFSLPPAGDKGPEGGNEVHGIDINKLTGGYGGHAIIIIWTNNGGGDKNTVWNEAPLEEGQVHQVTVGGPAGLVYSPEQLHAKPGDKIEFTFLAQNHTVTQSTFAEPCKKMEGGFNTGFIPNPNGTVTPPPKAMFQVTTEEPVWMYCGQKPHCSKGMVFSLNPTAEKTHEKFKETAINGAAPPPAGGAPPPPSPPAYSAAPPSPSVVSGHGTVGGDGACSCSCLCGSGSFPGVGIGGWGGSIPAPPAPMRRRSHF